jgi:hypothetical protein
MNVGRMRSWYLIVAVILVAVCSGVGAFYGLQGGQRTQSTENFEVIYSWGSGWTGMSDTITIRNDGNIVREYIPSFGGEENKITKFGEITESELQEFKELIISADVFEFENYYTSEHPPTDMPFTSIKFTMGTEIKTICMYYPENMPEKLEIILQKVSEFRDRL